MDNSNKKFYILFAGLLLLAIINTAAWMFPQPPKAVSVAGNGTGSMAAEDYNPYIMYNGGYYSQKPIETTSNLTVGGTFGLTGAATFNSTITQTSAGTTTAKGLSTSATKGFCFEFNATSTNQLLNLTFQGTTTASSPKGVIPVVQFGACN